MTASLHRFICYSALLLVSLLPCTNPVFAATAPDVTTLTSVSSGLSTPVRLAADSSGALYVSDPRGGGVVKFASNGSYAATIPVTTGILGIAIASNGNILVSQGSSVAVYSSGGVKQSQFGVFGKANGIAVTKTGDIFVVDSRNNNVQAFNANYTPRNGTANSFGGAGTTTGKFLQPTGITYEKAADQLAVTDTRNGRIQFFSPSGVYQKSIGSFGAGPLKFTSPQSVSFEYGSDQSLKRIYVVDSYQSTVQVIDGITGEFIRYIGGYGVTEGKLVTPSDILFDKNSRLVVANGTGKLSLFGVADPATGPYLQIDTVPQATNIATLAISGTTTGSSISISSGTATGTSISINGTLWNGNIALATGGNTITVVATDAKGFATSRTVQVTAIAPTANPVRLTVSPVASQTSQSTLALSGTVTSGGSVTVNGAAATVTGTGWSTTVPLSSGANSLNIAASKSGMGTSTVNLSIILDTSIPVIATRLPSPGSVFSTPMQTISGTVSSSSAVTMMLTVNGVTQAVPVSDGVFSLPLLLTIGSNSITVSGVDSYGSASQPLATSVVYDPQFPQITVSSPAAAVSGTALYKLAGTVTGGSSVTINGMQNATVSGTTWSADVQLTPGMNSFEVKATTPSNLSATAMTSVAYSPGVPSLSITSPAKDSPVATANSTIFGTASPGATVTARVNGIPVSVATSASGAFSIALPVMTSRDVYTVTVSATDAAGATSTSSRSILYDPTPPVITTVSTSPIKVTAAVLAAKDKNGPVGTVIYSGGVATLDLTGVVYDPVTLNIQAFSPAGLSSRNGDITLDGVVDISDALKALRVLAGLDPQPSFEQMLHGDIGPAAHGETTTDNQIRMSDVVVILEKIIGLSSW
ncbi:MAG: Ig-like domain-containing protein [Desulfuromonadaceae bacterium]|nr:Ig-like domain-containing protein [Desulfuromonadaceae bacterium]